MASNGNYQTQYGSGSRTQRGWGRPELLYLTVVSETIKKSVNINLSLFSGTSVGNLRSGIQNSIIEDLEFTVDENGSADFKLTLSRNPSFEILPNSIVKIAIGASAFNWYCGTIDYPEELGANTDKIELKGFGLRKFLNDLKANTTYTQGTDISSIIDDIVQTWIVPYCPISYNASKIDGPSGVVLAFDIQLGKYSIAEVLKTLILMAQSGNNYYVWGVDGNGDFYFSQLDKTVTNKTFFIGFNCHDFKPKLNFNNIKNVITVTRKNTNSTNASGWVVGGVYNDLSSVKKYGRQELTYQVPGYFTDSDCNLVGNALINNLAEPEYSAQAAGIQAWRDTDFLTNGIYRFIMPKMERLTYTEILNDLDAHTDFTISGAGDLAKANDTNIFMWANGSVKFTMQNAINQIAQMTILSKGFIKKISFYIRADYISFMIKYGIGDIAWNENVNYASVPIVNKFIRIQWDVSALNIREINKFGIQIVANYSQVINIWIDRLTVELAGHKTYYIPLKRASYKFSPDKSEVQAQFGGLPPSLVEYVAGLQEANEKLIYTGEVN